VIISVVGTDGAGKSTVTRRIHALLDSPDHPVRRVDRWDIVDNPAYPAARFMRPDVPDTRLCVAEMPTTSRFLFLMWSIGLALTGNRAAPDGQPVLLDGYWMKHAASETVYGLDRAWTESVTAGLPRSDLVFYLRLDPAVAWRRKRGRDVVPYECGMDPDCSEQSFLSHQQAILKVLDSWAERDGWTEIDAAAPLEEVVAAVADGIKAAVPALRDPAAGTPRGQ
jgi:thymidylate kinase